MRNNVRRRKIKKVNYKKLITLLIIFIAIILLLILGIKKITNRNNVQLGIEEGNTVQQETKEIPKDTTINLVAIGDIMCHSTNFKAAYDSTTKKYDFTSAFTNVAKYITKADIAIR